MEADIVRLYHQIEKGLAMPDFRPRFGEKLVHALIQRLDQWNERFPGIGQTAENRQVMGAYEALEQYIARHDELNIDVEDLVPKAKLRSTACNQGGLAGVKPLEQITGSDRDAFHRVVESRVSVRDFQSDRIPEREKVERPFNRPSEAHPYATAKHGACTFLKGHAHNKCFRSKMEIVDSAIRCPWCSFPHPTCAI